LRLSRNCTNRLTRPSFLPTPIQSRVFLRYLLLLCAKQSRALSDADRYAMPGAIPSALVFRPWNTPKKSLRRNNLQLIDVPHVFRM